MFVAVNLTLGAGVVIAFVGALLNSLRGPVMVAVGSWLCVLATVTLAMITKDWLFWVPTAVNAVIGGLATCSVIREARAE